MTANVVAQNLVYAAAFARCDSPGAAAQFWPEIARAGELFLAQMARRLDDPELAARAVDVIEGMIDATCRRPVMARPRPVGLGAA